MSGQGLRGVADNWLRLPQLRGLAGRDFDSLEATQIQRAIFEDKAAIRFLYAQYCRPMLESAARAPAGAVMLEVGAGAGLLKKHLPRVISSDLMAAPWLDLVCSAYQLPFGPQSLDRVFLLFVCHHLGRMEEFLNEAYRCLKPGGEMVVVDPAITAFSKFYYRHLHVDSLDLEADGWGFDQQGRLTDSNVALPWMVFVRDRQKFLAKYPGFSIRPIEYNTCLSYLLSGGLRLRQLLPTAALRRLFATEKWLIDHGLRALAATMCLTIVRT
ncbi:MAG: class I SAM-dependent methyltransferase [Pseudomonadota bacterium]